MTAGWMAPVVRGGSLLDRTAGPPIAAAIARADDWETARRHVAASAVGSVLVDTADRRDARVAVEESAAWQIRVLAGWLPPGGAALARLAIAPFEIANIDRHLLRLAGGDPPRPIDLGVLGAAWPRIAATTDTTEVSDVLRRSSWGDTGGTDRSQIVLGLRVSWARRSAAVDPIVRPWALGALAVLVARERFAFGRDIADTTARSFDRSLGARWRDADTVGGLVDRLPEHARWPLVDLDDADGLWRAELALLDRVTDDATDVLAHRRPTRRTMIAVLALLLIDTWRVTAAIEVAARDAAGEVLDALAT